MPTRQRKGMAAAGVTAAFFLLVEGGIRVSGVVASPVYTSPKGLTWAMASDLREESVQTREGLLFPVTTNHLGLRTPYEPGEDAGDRQTLLMLGDSIVFGWGVPDDATLPAQLEGALAKAAPAGHWRVINGGQPGYSSAQSYMLLRELGLQLAPDLVFLELAGHNTRTSLRSDLDYINDRSPFLSGLLEHSHSYRLLKRILRPEVASRESFWQEANNGMGQGPASEGESEGTRVPARDLALIFSDLGRLGRERGFVAVVSQPAFLRELGAEATEALQAADDAGDIVWLDCGAAMHEAGLDDSRYWIDDGYHWNKQGAGIAALMTARCLDEAGLLDGGSALTEEASAGP